MRKLSFVSFDREAPAYMRGLGGNSDAGMVAAVLPQAAPAAAQD
jgi:hypothetical protein